jgi:hypothetical protein
MMTDSPKLKDERPVQLSVWVPHHLSQRLDDLCKIVNASSAGRFHRKDVLAALLYSAPERLSDLQRILNEYANARPEQATVGADKGAKVYEFKRAKPGPRSN